MIDVLGDERLHEFIGGAPASLAELRERYVRMVADPGRADEAWRNWIVRTRVDDQPVGTVQATMVRAEHGGWTADVAWVIGVAWQGRGFASEAARALVGWLQDQGVLDVRANIHPDHAASGAVARAAGLHPTDRTVDGEVVWELPAS
jgi:RimJ/RimL family protein N-acetyltransferase